jgi:hypothetical protein
MTAYMAGRVVDGFDITPHDTNGLSKVTAAIWVGVTGHVRVRCYSSQNDLTFSNVPVGFLQVQADRVYATGTTATSLVGCVI